MAKDKSETMAMPAKPEPQAHVSWPSEGVKVSGSIGQVALNKKIRVVLEGPVKGFRHDEYGGSVDLKVKTINFESVGGEDEGEGPSMTDQVQSLKNKKK